MLGFLVMQERRAAGIKGIGRPEKSKRLWDAWKSINRLSAADASKQPDQKPDQQNKEDRLSDDE